MPDIILAKKEALDSLAEIAIVAVDELPADPILRDADTLGGVPAEDYAISADVEEHIADLANPHAVTKTQVGLGNVDNTSDANKPVSTAQATALGFKLDRYTTIASKTASYTLVLTDVDKLISVSSTSDLTVTVPLNSAVAFPVGTSIGVLRSGTGNVVIAPTAGVTIQSASGYELVEQYSGATLLKIATDTWLLTGDVTEEIV